jgi:hypothetical protein
MTTDVTMYECQKHLSSLTLKEEEDEEKPATEEVEEVCVHVHTCVCVRVHVHMHEFIHRCVYIYTAPFHFLTCVVCMRLIEKKCDLKILTDLHVSPT